MSGAAASADGRGAEEGEAIPAADDGLAAMGTTGASAKRPRESEGAASETASLDSAEGGQKKRPAKRNHQPRDRDVMDWLNFDWESYGAKLIGCYVKVYWTDDKQWWDARVQNYHPRTGEHYLWYPGDSTGEWIDFRSEPALVQRDTGWARSRGHGWWPVRVMDVTAGAVEACASLFPRSRVERNTYALYYHSGESSWLPKGGKRAGSELLEGPRARGSSCHDAFPRLDDLLHV